ncbi:urotensin 1 [Eucyclogobius newberryi]|uniref:urotensin 1 n=1 Tax=Eucyclogobius newberryi TaxID=166745 RepID=UPI003B59CF66
MKSSSLLLLVSFVLVSSPVARSSSAPPSLLSLLHSPLALHLLQLLNKRQDGPPGVRPPAPGPNDAAPETFRGTRDGPPLSIDLTFHLLRNMIHMAKLQGQREQALLNRRLLDEVGK